MEAIRRLWSNLPIKYKLLSYFFIILFFVSVFNMYLNNNNYHTMDQFNETMTNYYLINELMVTSQTNHQLMDQYLKERDGEVLSAYYASSQEIEALLERLYERFESRETFFSLRAISNAHAAYEDLWDEAISERKALNTQYYLPFYEGEDIYVYTIGYIEELLYISLREGTQMYNDLVEKADLMRTISLTLILVVFALALFIGGVFSSYLVRPIKKLADASHEMARGNLNVPAITVKRKDEIWVLAEAFNMMREAIRDYVVDLEQKVEIEKKLHEEELAIIKMEQLLKESEFQALQSQINPHFLFNTLNTISRTAMFEQADDTMKLIQALSNLFRYRIRNNEESVTLKEELDLIDQYMYLQKVRFKDRLIYKKSLSGNLEETLIPVFTLQPLVENAIIHGIEPKVDGGQLRIKVREDETKVMIQITDTGEGMSPEKRAEIIDFAREKKAKRIGVANVYHRIELFYQERGKIQMLSKKGLGTSVKITIYKEGGQEDEA